jgi:vacuolar-type H+-ATPase subunit I/STV1
LIITMVKVRLLGPKPLLRVVLGELQDLGLLHLTEPSYGDDLRRHQLAPQDRRRRRHLERALAATEDSLLLLDRLAGAGTEVAPTTVDREGAVALLAHRLRDRLEAIETRRTELVDERAALVV